MRRTSDCENTTAAAATLTTASGGGGGSSAQSRDSRSGSAQTQTKWARRRSGRAEEGSIPLPEPKRLRRDVAGYPGPGTAAGVQFKSSKVNKRGH